MALNPTEERKEAVVRRVLVVDDDAGLRGLIVKTLRREGFDAEGTTNGAEAIERATALPDTLLLLDQKLPDMTGREVVNALAGLGVMAPFVIMTGQGDERLAVEMMKLGAADYLLKDVELVERLPGVLERVFRTIEMERKLLEAEEAREKLQLQLSQAQKMESIGRLAGGVAHDFNNMLAVILGNVEMAMEQIEPTHALHAELQEVRKAAERSADLTRQLLAFARKQTVVPKVLDLNETVEGMLKMLRRLIGEHIELSWRPGGDSGQVKMDPSQIDQILVNLCVNARDAIGPTGAITIETGGVVLDDSACDGQVGAMPGDYVRLNVSDDGCGMDRDTQAHLFEPFFTTKGVGQGTGLGLATVYGIVKQNNGFVSVYSEPGEGTTFKIYLPRHAARAEAAVAEGSAAPPKPGHATILLVEDEPAILNMVRSLLQRWGYAVIAASMPGEAIRLAERYPGEIDLLISDVVMPEMNGRDLAKSLLALYPGLKRLFMSGHTADILAHHGVLDGGVHFIQKPFSMKGLQAKLGEVLGEKADASPG